MARATLNETSLLHPGDLASTISRKTRVRYRLATGPTTYYNGRGFRSRAEVDAWLAQQVEKYGLDWRSGYFVKLRGFAHPFRIVTNAGKELQPA